jgi:thiol:disulfide interchange protein
MVCRGNTPAPAQKKRNNSVAPHDAHSPRRADAPRVCLFPWRPAMNVMNSQTRLPGRRAVVLALLGLAFAGSGLAGGAPFDRNAFEAAQKAGLPILLTVHADWCVTCRTQDPIVASLLRDPKFANYVTFRVDFDTQKDLLKQFRVQWQSTLIVFKGRQEVARSTAVTERDAIAAQLAKAL